MSFTEKPVFVLVNDIFWWGGICREKLLHQLFGQSAVVKQKEEKKKKKKMQKAIQEK